MQNIHCLFRGEGGEGRPALAGQGQEGSLARATLPLPTTTTGHHVMLCVCYVVCCVCSLVLWRGVVNCVV